MRAEQSDYRFNTQSGSGKKGIAVSGVSGQYIREAMQILDINNEYKLLNVATPHPFPEQTALAFLDGLDEVLVYEELDPVIEQELQRLCGVHRLSVEILGKGRGFTPTAGEDGTENALTVLRKFFDLPTETPEQPAFPPLPVRPPTLCAGCPHRASFYAVKRAMKGRKAVFAGDIGCYTLGNAMPLDMTDTCLCMGAGITVAQGIKRVEPDTVCFSFTGDSTFFHTGLVGIANAVYNGAKIVSVILDNSTTAMTAQQPNPSTGFAATGEPATKISIEKVVEALGVKHIAVVDPFDFEGSERAVKEAADFDGVSCIIFRAPCIGVSKPKAKVRVNAGKCTGCKRCVREIGCPAIIKGENGKVAVDASLCFGCGLCLDLCRFDAFERGEG